MSYYITITECNLEYTNLDGQYLDPTDFFYAWYKEEKDVLPADQYIQWSNGLIKDFHRMIEQGIRGSIEIRDVEGEYTLFKLTKDAVDEYHRHTTYSTAPDVVHKRKEKEVEEDEQ